MSTVLGYSLMWVGIGIIFTGLDGIWEHDGVDDMEANLFATVVYIIIWPLILLYKIGHGLAKVLKFFGF
jgi:hypothetical protein